MSAIDWAKFCAGMQRGDVRVNSEGRVTETTVAHVMSQSEAVQHVSANAKARLIGYDRESVEEMVAGWNCVLRTAAEWQEMEDMFARKHALYQSAQRQLAAKTAECERLMQLVTDHAECSVALGLELKRLREGREDGTVADSNHRGSGVDLRLVSPDWLETMEGLREGREDETGTDQRKESAQGRVVGVALEMGSDMAKGRALVATKADTLDPRFGIQQPEGEPVQPMPYWRRRMGE